MENKPEPLNDKKSIGKVRSCNNGPLLKFRNEAVKRKSFTLNEAVMSLDLALGRLKKSKLEGGECGSSRGAVSPGQRVLPPDMFMDMSSPSGNINPGLTHASLMSMNFSHYELIRNLSRSTSNSEGAFSGTTCNTYSADTTLKDEHLEKYFRSVELWNKKYRDTNNPNSGVHFQFPEK